LTLWLHSIGVDTSTRLVAEADAHRLVAVDASLVNNPSIMGLAEKGGMARLIHMTDVVAIKGHCSLIKYVPDHHQDGGVCEVDGLSELLDAHLRLYLEIDEKEEKNLEWARAASDLSLNQCPNPLQRYIRSSIFFRLRFTTDLPSL